MVSQRSSLRFLEATSQTEHHSQQQVSPGASVHQHRHDSLPAPALLLQWCMLTSTPYCQARLLRQPDLPVLAHSGMSSGGQRTSFQHMDKVLHVGLGVDPYLNCCACKCLSFLCSTGITNFVELGASNLGLIRIAANLSGPGPFRIETGGSTAVISLPQSTCPQQEQPGTPKLAGLWNVLTTTSMSSLTADRLAYLVLQHTQYHRCVTGNVFLQLHLSSTTAGPEGRA